MLFDSWEIQQFGVVWVERRNGFPFTQVVIMTKSQSSNWTFGQGSNIEGKGVEQLTRGIPRACHPAASGRLGEGRSSDSSCCAGHGGGAAAGSSRTFAVSRGLDTVCEIFEAGISGG